MKQRKKSKSDFKNKVIQRQTDQIRSLEQQIADLEIDCDTKDEIVKSIEPLKKELEGVIDDLKSKSEKYDELIDDLTMMRTAFNKEVFKGRWKLIKFLMR